MKSCWGVANFLSLGNAACGTLSLFQMLSHHLQSACLFIFGAVIFDFLDGKTARYLSQATIFGKGLDCLSDLISFGAAPAAFGFIMLDSPGVPAQALLILFVLAGVFRLAYYFQWTHPCRPPGMPITFNGLIFPTLYFLHLTSSLDLMVAFALSTLLMAGPHFLKPLEIS